MKFRNLTDDAREIPALGVTVPAGDTTPDLDDDQSAGLIGQVETWAAVGTQAKAAQRKAADPAPDDVKE